MLRCLIPLVVIAWLSPAAPALDEQHQKLADAAIARGFEFLHFTQNDDGSWSPKAGPAVTALVLAALLDQPHASLADPMTARALEYVLGKVKPDGGIHDGMLENYNTAIALSALSRVHDRPNVAQVVRNGQDFLRRLQWADQLDEHGTVINQRHPFYGGAGYGSHGRPDLSNTQIMLQGLHDSGLPSDDPVYKRALLFIQRCQGIASNVDFGGQIVNDGGFIYATSIDKDHVGVPQSMASPEMVDEGKAGRPVSGLRTYGSMTYAGFKSYLYAKLERDDPRVVAAFEWIQNNYTLDRNPGLPEAIQMHGYYYYLLIFARALRAWGEPTITTADGVAHHWAQELVAKLAVLQRPDGSWVNDADRWMEGDPNLVTAYALNALMETKR